MLREEWLPFEQLLTGDPTSPQFADSEKRRLFYAEAWGIVHMLLTEQPARSKELGEYARRTAAGVDPVSAWHAVFGPEDPKCALKNHVARQVFGAYDIRFPAPIRAEETAAVVMSQPDVDATLGDVLRIVAPASEAASRLERASTVEPVSWRARALLGLLKIDEGNATAARTSLLDATRNSDDWLGSHTRGRTHDQRATSRRRATGAFRQPEGI